MISDAPSTKSLDDSIISSQREQSLPKGIDSTSETRHQEKLSPNLMLHYATCNFRQFLEDSLRDQFVCGLRHEAIQRRLLSEADLKYDKAIDVAKAMEPADKNTKAFKGLAEIGWREFSVLSMRSTKTQCG